MGATLTVGLSRLVEEASKSGQGLTGQVLDKIVGEMSEAFQVKLDEVAVLHLTHNGAVLSFLYPLKLQKSGQRPDDQHFLAGGANRAREAAGID